MLKNIFFSIVILCFALPFAAAAPTLEGEGSRLLTIETNRLAQKLLLENWKNSLASGDTFDAGKAGLQKSMQENADSFALKSQAEPRAGELLTQIMEKSLLEEKTKAAASFGENTGSLVLTPEEKTFCAAQSRRLFPLIYPALRQEIASAQRERVFRTFYPSLQELETLSDEALAGVLETRFRKGVKEVLWEENLPLLKTSLIQPAISAGRKQQARQLELVSAIPVPENLWQEQEVAAYLRHQELELLAGEFPLQEARYSLFAATERALRDRARSLPAERAAAMVPKLLDQEKYRKLLEAETDRHLTRRQSWERCAEVWNSLPEEAVAAAAVPPDLRPVLAADPELRTRIRQNLEKAAEVKFVPEREAFAEIQLAAYWPDLAKEWIPRPEETEAFDEAGGRTLPSIADRPAGQKGLLEETSAREERILREKLQKERSRLLLQRQAMEDLYRAVLEEMKLRQQAFLKDESGFFARIFGQAPSEVTLSEIISHYTSNVISRSSEPLFPSVKEGIEVRARAIYQLIRQDPEKPQELPVVTFTVTLRGNPAEPTLGINEYQTVCRKGNIPEREVAETFQKLLAEVQEPSQFRIRLLVQHPQIYYITVDSLKNTLKSVLEGCLIEDSFLAK